MRLRLSIALFALLTMTGCDYIQSLFTPKPDIQFATYSTDYQTKPDFALLEHKFPLTAAELTTITPRYLATLDQEQVDQIYARLTAGPIPDGAFEGALFFPRGGSGHLRLSEIVGGLPGLVVQLKGKKLDLIGETLWKGKVFYRDQRLLRNRIEDLNLLRTMGLVDAEPQKIDVKGKDAWLLFPAKLYCGQSMLDSRRESVIIDYAFTDEIAGYMEKPDFLAGRRGFKVRDEIRMVRPGLYLGRAYLDRIFILNFTLVNDEIAKRDGESFTKTGQAQEDCWAGTQPRKVMAVK
ncbi:MAG: hypothetical protein ABIW48_10075 [Burkholderiales bacterium]